VDRLNPTRIQALERYFKQKVTRQAPYAYWHRITLEDSSVYQVFEDEYKAKEEAGHSLASSMKEYPEAYASVIEPHLYMPKYLKKDYCDGEAQELVTNMSREELYANADVSSPESLEEEISEIQHNLSESSDDFTEKGLYTLLKKRKQELALAKDLVKLRLIAYEHTVEDLLEKLKDPVTYFIKEGGIYDNLEGLLKSGLAKYSVDDAVEEYFDLHGMYGELSPYDGKEHVIGEMYAYRQE
jgi:hypothetical protein